MFNSIKIKVGIVLLILVIIISSIIYYQDKTIKALKNELATNEINYKWKVAHYENEMSNAKDIINKLNNSIAEFILDKDNYELEINEKEKEILVTKIKKQEDIKKELERDNSIENQLKIITVILEDFSK